jgi:phosphatidylserine decarboxylase
MNLITNLKKFATDAETRKKVFRGLWLLIVFIYNTLSLKYYRKNKEQIKFQWSLSRKTSRIAGDLTHHYIPTIFRKPIYLAYSKMYGVRLNEIQRPLESFETFNEFFTRTIAPRPVEQDPLAMVSPADSRVLTYSEVTGDEVLVVKGIEYKLGEFLTGVPTYKIENEELQSMKKNPMNKLYQIILYLAPGDYHRYHAPTDCGFRTRNHIVGKLKPVKERYVKTHTHVYEKNERVSLFGDWIKGLMCMVFVGALNVGSIDLNFDKDLQTNTKLKMPFSNTDVKLYTQEGGDGNKLTNQELLEISKGNAASPVQVTKGEEMGKFNLGSTIVLVFEASPDFEWNVQPGDKVEYGQLLGKSK